ncbi:DDE-type integrase/transposase/recombinase [Oceanirhabdus sp. W0125-5]|uniref:DDE-type integrase/transposase/recombinase n=1 Tax=Oceanirhabdus sp. W0125-5 TaxID=2999116 RepID=UPI0022F2D565|nr:DDE-type integrase/transposase/recombinase [Oceanirhabdus sp. W0125-5]WBW94854.1 DDE-type integrase/transposase/recombinase [Oceanirhabdus sp. W0125-5]WBW96404.1 DDE-type integrase/transposase/recombinase [Oceanirhabdus sp. W0125-5]WBW97032.1 DDE-type integrase/transposase/recombinase [Oceanirhabdus sp. W0125-5]WBW97874.1 DDE-type integrase/transposase/recombinase [Oceanirhabdus sp. W0125-5]WBW98968.1 DDE-type integrase/transposase/recombinase [Oceanirhabdus sp. W0125-5]
MINYYLVLYIVFLKQVINLLIILLTGKGLNKIPNSDTLDKPYRKIQVDDKPIIVKPERLDYRELLSEHYKLKGKELAPVRTQKGRSHVSSKISCPKCNAPNIYLYDNNGGRGQYKCKVCSTNFNTKNLYDKQVRFKCPHCNKFLERIKNRSNFTIYKCRNNNCSFYKNNLKSITKEKPYDTKVRYIFREFDFDFASLKGDSPVQSNISLSKMYSSSHVFGLIMTYYVNYGLSSRKTAAIMREVHCVKISHQTVLNYAAAASVLLKPMVDNYPYNPTESICGDETYIKVNGKWNYICFFFDAVKKIILSYRVSPNRDTFLACRAIYDVITKYEKLPESLKLVVDGNPIYLLAEVFFANHDINFDVMQVIGLTNDDEVSAEYRPLKQIIERLNRTFKRSYKTTNGYNSSNGSITHIILFCTYFNFLKPHASLEQKVPVIIPELEELETMPARWCKLMKLAESYCQS